MAGEGGANLTLMGIEPTYPSEKYGYIIPENAEAVSPVDTFKEKPDARTAADYIARGALWNGGVFAYKLGYVLDRARELIGFTDYQDLYQRYETLPKISFDYAVVEKEPRIQVMRFAGQWKDMGTWNTLTEAMAVSYTHLTSRFPSTVAENAKKVNIMLVFCKISSVASPKETIK